MSTITTAFIARSWEQALALWGTGVSLSPPEAFARPVPGAFPRDEPLAYIDMERRQVVVNFEQLEAFGAAHALTAVLAHEVGHHIRFPHTLGLAAALQVLEQRLLPTARSLTNLFFDLQVNEHVGRTHADELIAVYRGFVARDPQVSSLFSFYLAIYEELWRRGEGDIVPAAMLEPMEERHPGWRIEARMFAQTFWALDDVYLQFVYFCSVVQRYLEPDPQEQSLRFPLAGDVPGPDVDDWASAMNGSGAADRALEEATARGWIEAGEAEVDPFAVIGRAAGQQPGAGGGVLQRALVGHLYRRLVDRHMIDVPKTAPGPAPDAWLPSTTVDWEPGDDVRSIDWTQSVLSAGALAGVRPLRRELLVDEPLALGSGIPSIEIYLDTSGSMPSPLQAKNALTLAAQILAAAAIRRGGRARAVVYSAGNPLVSEWLRHEEAARDFLLHTIGGGTDYPFQVLRESAADRADVVRVVISDGDFLSNCGPATAMDTLVYGVSRSARFVALLFLPNRRAAAESTLARVMSDPRFRLVTVDDLADLGAAAGALARALFGER